MFVDRSDAGRRLATELAFLEGTDPVVTGLPRGGVPVAREVARALGADLDVILVRKIGLPYQPELAMGAIGEDGVRVLNDDVIGATTVTPREFDEVERRERAELDRRVDRYRAVRPAVPLTGRTVVIVDDGIATGSTARAACQVAHAHGALRIVLAAPVASPRALAVLARDADDIVCVEAPSDLMAVGQAYQDFSAVSEDDVIDLLRRSRSSPQARVDTAARDDPVGDDPVGDDPVGDDPPVRDEEVTLAVDGGSVGGHLTVPEEVAGFVIFAHGSGSSRHSSRNRFVATALNEAGFGTLLFDLLTPDEELDRSNVFDVDLLAQRLLTVTDWLRSQPEAAGRPIGYFGASTGAGAALCAAADPRSDVAAVVSRGGRPDLAGPKLTQVTTPTLLIVGGRDEVVLGLNRQAQARLSCRSELVVVPGATHLFEEQGALADVARLAGSFFGVHMSAPVGEGRLPPGQEG